MLNQLPAKDHRMLQGRRLLAGLLTAAMAGAIDEVPPMQNAAAASPHSDCAAAAR
jgi:hypothetical protein